MAGFRDLFLKQVHRPAAPLPPRLLRRLSGQRLILPFYHLVSDEAVPHIRHLYPVKNRQQFAADLDFLLRYYEPLDFAGFCAWAKGEKTLAKPAFLLSFDDGLREFHDVIAPVLLEKGIPAVCFLNSAFINNRDLFYRYKAGLLLDRLHQESRLFEMPEVEQWRLQYFPDGPDLAEALRSVPYQRRHCLDELARLVGCSFEAYLAEQQPYLTSEQVRSLRKDGFAFGAHSIDHPEYRFLDLDEQLRQTAESIDSICREFELDYRAFSFPFTDYGVSRAFFERVRQDRIADFTFGCAGQKQDSAPRHFQRIPFESGQLSARQIHNAELLYYLCKAPFGKNTIRRR